MHCEWLDVAYSYCVELCAAAVAAAAVETVVVAVAVVATGDSGADAGAADAAGEHTAPVAVETEIGSTQQYVVCGKEDPGHHTQGATGLAVPSHLMRKRKVWLH